MRVDAPGGTPIRTVAVVTGSRADYGLYRPILAEIVGAPELRLRLMVCGAHLSRAHGHTVDEIERDGYPIADRVETLADRDSPEAIGESIGRGTTGFSRAFGRQRPDLVMLLGDRYEMIAVALAALPFALPIAHIHGGELSEGAIDDGLVGALGEIEPSSNGDSALG